MDEASFYRILLVVWAGLAVLTIPLLRIVTAPYGRHVREGWGPTLPGTVGWVLMELPALAVVVVLILVGPHGAGSVPRVFLAMWCLHYVNRTLVFPFRRRGGRGGGKPMPLSIAGSAFFFNLVNAYLQGRWLGTLSPPYAPDWLLDPRFLLGAALFLAGFAANVHADETLRRLRRPGETGYRIPRGGLYRWVSCPNYLGEILEWCGWALATWSLSGLVFALWTVANLAPRALANHRWYHENFPGDYPPERRALVPFLL